MKSESLGKRGSDVEVSHISQHGLWLLFHDRELFVPFSEFPWFKDASIGSILRVEMPHPRHLYWPDLDVDLAVDSIDHPRAISSCVQKPFQIAIRYASLTIFQVLLSGFHSDTLFFIPERRRLSRC